MIDLFTGDFAREPVPLPLMTLAVLLALACGLVLAWTYMITHSGLSYSRTFVNSLIVIPVVVSLVMMVMSNNLVTAFGLMAVFAMVRFRNILRDTLDTSHILGCIVVGMACGTHKFSTAIVSCAAISGILLFLWATRFGERHRYDVILNLRWTRPMNEADAMRRVLRRHSRRVEQTSERGSGGGAVDLAYRILLRDPSRMEEMLAELKPLEGVEKVTGLRARDESEA